MLIDKDGVIAFIPHRDPFLFIDSIESVDYESEVEIGVYNPKSVMGAKVIAHYHVPESLEIFKGHFPGNPVLPGVIQTEMTAQASTFTLYKLVKDPKNVKLNVALLNVTQSKYRKPVKPGMSLKLIVTCTRVRGKMMNYEGQIYCGEDLMSETAFMATVSIED